MKTLKEILNGQTRLYYSRHAEQLASLAITAFAEEIEKKGGVILSCSPKQIKLDDGTIMKVIGNWIKYSYNESIYMIQFDKNPFFGPSGYLMDKHGRYTGLLELPMLYYNVDEYSTDIENVKKLTKNISIGEEYLKKSNMIHKGKYKFKQEIYYFI